MTSKDILDENYEIIVCRIDLQLNRLYMITSMYCRLIEESM